MMLYMSALTSMVLTHYHPFHPQAQSLFAPNPRRDMMNMRVKIEDVLVKPKWPEEPFYRPGDFSREDESSDGGFYSQPRLVYHIDEPAVRALSDYYAVTFPGQPEVLDICSSWVSHFPAGVKLKRAVGLGKSIDDEIGRTHMA